MHAIRRATARQSTINPQPPYLQRQWYLPVVLMLLKPVQCTVLSSPR
jgi:hypothetical protein